MFDLRIDFDGTDYYYIISFVHTGIAAAVIFVRRASFFTSIFAPCFYQARYVPVPSVWCVSTRYQVPGTRYLVLQVM